MGAPATSDRPGGYDLSTEQVVLAGLLVRPERWTEIADLVQPAHFTRRLHEQIYRMIGQMALAGDAIDVITVAERLTEAGLGREIQNGAYLTGLANDYSHLDPVAHAGRLREKATALRAREIGQELSDGPGTAQAVDSAIRQLMDLTAGDRRHEHPLSDGIRLAVDDLMEMMDSDREIRGITTGLDKLDKHLGGLQDSDLVVVGARPAMGKTAILLGMAMSAAGRGGEGGVPVGLISAEQPLVQVAQRHQASESRVPLAAIRHGRITTEQSRKLVDVSRLLARAPYWVYDKPGPTIDEVIRVARRWHQRHGMRVLYLDYIQKIKGLGDSRAYQVEDVASGLKNLAKELEIPVVALAQVNRSVEQRPNRRPRMSDLKDSGAIEQEADQVITLYRDEVYHDDSPDKGIAELEICKNRHGYIGMVKVAWLGEFVRFETLDELYGSRADQGGYDHKGAVD